MLAFGHIFAYFQGKEPSDEYEIIESQGIPVRVAKAESLIMLKKDTILTRDKADVMYLEEKLKEGK